MTHHDFQELDDDFGTRPDQDLPFAPFLSVVNGFQSIAQYVHAHHLETFVETWYLWSVNWKKKKQKIVNLIVSDEPTIDGDIPVPPTGLSYGDCVPRTTGNNPMSTGPKSGRPVVRAIGITADCQRTLDAGLKYYICNDESV